MSRNVLVTAAGIALSAVLGFAQAPATGPYSVVKTAKVGGDGGFDYVFADAAGRRLYIPRTGPTPRVTVFDLDSLKPAGEISKTNARGAAVDPKSGHGFASSKPVAMWDTKTMELIKTIDVQGGPDGILFDSFNQRVWVFSHGAPNATVIDTKDGSVVGTVDLGGAPEQAVTDGNGHMYVDIEDKDNVAVVDTKTMTVTAHYELGGNGTPAGLAFDVKNHVLFVACRQPAPGMMVMLNSQDGKIITTLPLGGGSDGVVFNPATMEAFSSAANATLTIIKEKSPASFEVEQTLTTMTGGKTLTLDSKTNHVLIIAAEYGPPPPPAADASKDAPKKGGGRGGRAPMLPDSFSILVVGK